MINIGDLIYAGSPGQKTRFAGVVFEKTEYVIRAYFGNRIDSIIPGFLFFDSANRELGRIYSLNYDEQYAAIRRAF